MAITPGVGYQVDPNNPNGVIPISSGVSLAPAVPAAPVSQTMPTPPVSPVTPAIPPTPPSPTTSAPDQTNAGKPGYDVFGNPVAGGTANIDSARQASGTYRGQDGQIYYNYDNSPVNGTSVDNGYKTPVPTTGNAGIDTLTAQRMQEADDLQRLAKQTSDTITGIQNGAVPLSAGDQAQIDGLKQQFQQMITEQGLVTTGASGLANVRGYQTGAAEYDPTFQVKTINSVVTAGANKIADLQIKEASAVASLTQALKDNNIKAVQNAWDIYSKAADAHQTALKETIDATQKAIKDAQDAKAAADKVIQDTVTTPINDIAKSAAQNGASADTLAKIKSAMTVQDAITAAGTSLQTGTGMVGEYLFYKQQAEAAGQTPVDFNKYQDMDAARKAQATANASGSLTIPETPVGLGATDGGGSILTATGLSVAAFNFLTQGVTSMSRMPATQRTQIMNEAQKWLNDKGVDISTFQSQYKAYNDVLQKNIARANQTQIMAGEVSGSADALMQAIDEKDMSSIKAANILDLMLGNQVNDPTTMKYASQLQFMANDLAGYYAASRGATSPELQDQRDAANLIASGMNKGSVQAFKDSINSNEEKVATVVNRAVDNTRKQVWGLFGVGSKYKGGNSTSDSLIQQNQDDPLGLGPTTQPDNSNNPLGI